MSRCFEAAGRIRLHDLNSNAFGVFQLRLSSTFVDFQMDTMPELARDEVPECVSGAHALTKT